MAVGRLPESLFSEGKSWYRRWAPAQPHTLTRKRDTNASSGTGPLTRRRGTCTSAVGERNSAHEVHLCYRYNILNYALRSFRQSDSEACSYQSMQGKGAGEIDKQFDLSTLMCVRVTNCRSLVSGLLKHFFLKPRHFLSKNPKGSSEALAATLSPSLVLFLRKSAKENWFSALVRLGVGVATTLPKKQCEQMPRLYFPEFLACRPFEAVFLQGWRLRGQDGDRNGQ